MVESSLYKGPIYFDCYPNFAVSLTDETVLQTLELDIETSGYNMLEGVQPLVIVYRPIPVQNTLKDDLDYINQHLDGSVSINFQPFRKFISYSSSARYSNPYKEKIVSPPRCNFNKLKLQENPRIDDDLRHSIDKLNDLRLVEQEDRSQKLDLDKFKKPSTNSNYTNSNLDGIIKGNVINTHSYSTSSQIPQKRPYSPTNSEKV